METINTLIEELAYLVSDLLSNLLSYGLLGGFIGLALGIFIVRRLGKKGFFKRSNPFWTFLANCNYVLLPLALFLTGLTQGGIYGVHNTAEEWIDQTTSPIVDYAEGYLPQLQSFCNTHLLGKEAESMTIEQLVVAQNPKQSGGVKGSVLTNMNVFLVGAFLDVTSGRGDVAEPVVLLSQIDIEHLDRNVFEILPASMRAVAGFYFAGIYWAFFAPFGLFFLVVIGEMLLYRFLLRPTPVLLKRKIEYDFSEVEMYV